MSRLTNTKLADALENGYFVSIDSKTVPVPTVENLYIKLSKYEKIEEELGIDLITFFKVISQGYIFVREHNTEEKEIVAECVEPNFLTHTFDFKEPRKEIGKGRPFSRIGETWALTREELEK